MLFRLGLLFAGILVFTGFHASPSHSAANQNPLSAAKGESCLIKGNINDQGKRFYHLPGDKYYDHIRISPQLGERWFCSESEARTAGFEHFPVPGSNQGNGTKKGGSN